MLLALVSLALRMVAIFLALKTGAGAVWNYVILFLEYTALLSAGLAVFNLFPIPPLDGSKILLAVLPGPYYAKWMRYERYGMILLVILLLLNVLDTPLLFLRSQVDRRDILASDAAGAGSGAHDAVRCVWKNRNTTWTMWSGPKLSIWRILTARWTSSSCC